MHIYKKIILATNYIQIINDHIHKTKNLGYRHLHEKYLQKILYNISWRDNNALDEAHHLKCFNTRDKYRDILQAYCQFFIFKRRGCIYWFYVDMNGLGKTICFTVTVSTYNKNLSFNQKRVSKYIKWHNTYLFGVLCGSRRRLGNKSSLLRHHERSCQGKEK